MHGVKNYYGIYQQQKQQLNTSRIINKPIGSCQICPLIFLCVEERQTKIWEDAIMGSGEKEYHYRFTYLQVVLGQFDLQYS